MPELPRRRMRMTASGLSTMGMLGLRVMLLLLLASLRSDL
jgi:hypothetical protein